LAADPELRRRLVDAGRATAATLTSDALACALEQFHERARGDR
jgi:hypothetical protein